MLLVLAVLIAFGWLGNHVTALGLGPGTALVWIGGLLAGRYLEPGTGMVTGAGELRLNLGGLALLALSVSVLLGPYGRRVRLAGLVTLTAAALAAWAIYLVLPDPPYTVLVPPVYLVAGAVGTMAYLLGRGATTAVAAALGAPVLADLLRAGGAPWLGGGIPVIGGPAAFDAGMLAGVLAGLLAELLGDTTLPAGG